MQTRNWPKSCFKIVAVIYGAFSFANLVLVMIIIGFGLIVANPKLLFKIVKLSKCIFERIEKA